MKKKDLDWFLETLEDFISVVEDKEVKLLAKYIVRYLRDGKESDMGFRTEAK